jgi:methionine-rich copper-binding protein CopC
MTRFLAGLSVAVFCVFAAPTATFAHEGDDASSSSETTLAPTDASTLTAVTLDEVSSGPLASSWPRDGVVLWVPPREGRLTFLQPVQASTMTLELVAAEQAPEELVRLTRGDDVTEILYRFTSVRPGTYIINWTVDAVDGHLLEGSIAFELEAPIEAAGGQNHRHGDAHLYEDSAGQYIPRLFFVLGASMILLGVLRTARRQRQAVSDKIAVRVGAVVLGITALVVALLDVVNWIDTYHDYPLSAFAAAPGLGIVLPMLGFVAYALVSAPTTRRIGVAAALSLALHAGLSHAVQTPTALQLFIVFTASLIAVAVTWATLASLVLDTLRSRRVNPRRIRRELYLLIAAALGTSLLMLLLHAGTLALELDFRAALWFRLVAGALACGGVWLTVQLNATKQPLLRLVSIIPASVVVAATAALLWMPPPAAGI